MSELKRNSERYRQQRHCIDADAVRAERMAKVAFVAGLRGAKLREVAEGLSCQEVLDIVENSSVGRVVRIAIVTRQTDIDLLVSIACGKGEPFVRRDALQRLDVLQQDEPLTRAHLDRLCCCLRTGELVAATVALMDAAGFDWCSRCDERVADAMCAALYGAQGIAEEVVIEDAFAQLAHCRPDLAGSLRACSPERFLPQALQPPARTITLIDLVRCEDVA